jgi:hypothetical protein
MGSKKTKYRRNSTNGDSAYHGVNNGVNNIEETKDVEETKNIDEIKELKDAISNSTVSDDTSSIIEEGLGEPVPEEIIDVEEYSRAIDEVYRHGDDSFLDHLDNVSAYDAKSQDSAPKLSKDESLSNGSSNPQVGGFNAGYTGANAQNAAYAGGNVQNTAGDAGYNNGYPQNGPGNGGYNAGYPQNGGVNMGYNAGYPQNGGGNMGYNTGYPQNGGVNMGYNGGYPQNAPVNNGYNGYPQNGPGNMGYNGGYPQNNGGYAQNNGGYPQNGGANMGYNNGYHQVNGRRNYDDYYNDESDKGSRTPLIIAVTVAAVAVLAAIAIIVSNQNRTTSDNIGETTNIAAPSEQVTEKDDYSDETEEATENIVTEAPTTEASTTEAPTTEAPTTEAPTTEAPTTEAPTEEATTEAPTEPVTEEPTTEYVPVQVDIVGKSYSYSSAPEELAAVISDARRIAGLADDGGVKSMKANQSVLYYDDDSNVIRIDLEPGSSYGNTTYEEFYFKNNKLIFADYYKDNKEFEDVTRFYYLDGKVIGYSETASDTVHYYSDGRNPADFAYSAGQPDLYARAKALNSNMTA